MITSLKLNGREFYGPWFDATAPEVLDYTYDASGQVVAGPDSAISGPVEEFAPIDFTPTPGSHFVKIGVGILYQPDNAPYDHYRHYKILDGGQRTARITPRSSTFIQTVNDAGTGLRLFQDTGACARQDRTGDQPQPEEYRQNRDPYDGLRSQLPAAQARR